MKNGPEPQNKDHVVGKRYQPDMRSYSDRIDYDEVIEKLSHMATSSTDSWALIAIAKDTQPASRLKRRYGLLYGEWNVSDIQTFTRRTRPGIDGVSLGYEIWARKTPQKNHSVEKPLEKVEQKKGW